MGKRQLFYITCALLLSGCFKDTSESYNDEPINGDGSIAFRIDSMLTKGTPQPDLTAYSQVNLIAYSHTGNYNPSKSLYRQIKLNKQGSGGATKWDYTPHMYWPEERNLSFLSYASDQAFATAKGSDGVFIDGDASKGAPVMEYTVPKDVTKQPDLLVSTLLNHAKVNNVTLPMKHALACVSFCATGGPDMKVKSITIKKVYSKGRLALDDASLTWTPDPNSKGLTAHEPGIKTGTSLEENPTNKNYLMTANGYLMMIPQTLTDAYIDVIYWKGTAGTEKTTSYPLPTTVAWEAGKKYIYQFGEASEVVVYYERYADGTFGFQSLSTGLAPLDDTKEISSAGYGILSKSDLVSNAPTIVLGTNNPVPTTKVAAASGEYDLYMVSQTGAAGTTFVLPTTSLAPVDVYFDGNSVACGKIVPHFAKGVSNTTISINAIRTPQQMRNISAVTGSLDNASNPTYGKIFKQERNLDFSKQPIGGGNLTAPVVDEMFNGTYNSDLTKEITNLTITAPGMNDVGLFSRNNGTISRVVLKGATIQGTTQVGGILGENWFAGLLDKNRVIGTANTPGKKITISGTSSVGGIVGANRGRILGNPDIETATQVTIAEVSGWVNISASSNSVGGIAGYNNNTVQTTLVHGVLVSGTTFADSKITIQGGYYVGGVVGENWKDIIGNITASGKNMPDVAGLLEITGTSNIGGIVGINAGDSKLNSVNIRSGRATPTIIRGTGGNVGGIAGENRGTLGVDNTSSFISARGNIRISGFDNVGGIVGNNNSPTAALQNCFVYDFKNPTYYAPKIESASINAGGIVGNNNGASITDCGVFSTSAEMVSIIANSKNAGGIAGFNGTGGTTTGCSVIGKVEVNAKQENAGGFIGGNTAGTIIQNCWIGNSDGNSLLKNAIANLGLVITPPTGTITYEIPYITGGWYIGGAVGLNAGVISNILLSDNVKIGREDGNPAVGGGSMWVGGIVGGNSAGDGSTFGVIKDCKVENKPGKTITIQGSNSLGGIAGLSNGLIDNCHVSGTSGAPLKIIGLGTIGGIVGQVGGHEYINMGKIQFGNDKTIIRNSSVTGYVTIQGNGYFGWTTAIEVGGIAGLNGTTKDNINNIDNCWVRGAAANSIVISVAGTAGGIAGTNTGNINNSSVQNASITSVSGYAGGIAGQSSSSAATASPTSYRSNMNVCKVYSGVSISGAVSGNIKPGALVGYLDSKMAISFGNETNPNLINSSGVTVNGIQPSALGHVIGFSTGGVTMYYTIKAL